MQGGSIMTFIDNLTTVLDVISTGIYNATKISKETMTVLNFYSENSTFSCSVHYITGKLK